MLHVEKYIVSTKADALCFGVGALAPSAGVPLLDTLTAKREINVTSLLRRIEGSCGKVHSSIPTQNRSKIDKC